MIGPVLEMAEASANTGVRIPPFLSSASRSSLPSKTLKPGSAITFIPNTWGTKPLKLTAVAASSRSTSPAPKQTDIGKLQPRIEADNPRKGRVFFLDVNPLCYQGTRPSLHSFGRWLSIFFEDVSHSDPVIAVSALVVELNLLSIIASAYVFDSVLMHKLC